MSPLKGLYFAAPCCGPPAEFAHSFFPISKFASRLAMPRLQEFGVATEPLELSYTVSNYDGIKTVLSELFPGEIGREEIYGVYPSRHRIDLKPPRWRCP